MKKLQTILTVLLAVLLLTGCAVSAATLPPEELTRNTAPERMTPEEAAAIALEEAGLTAGQAARLRTEYDLDDGVPEYEVEFRSGRLEYDFEIHAETGKILDYDCDD